MRPDHVSLRIISFRFELLIIEAPKLSTLCAPLYVDTSAPFWKTCAGSRTE